MLYIFSGSLYRTFANFETNLKTLKNEQVKLSSAVDLLDTVHVNGNKKKQVRLTKDVYTNRNCTYLKFCNISQHLVAYLNFNS